MLPNAYGATVMQMGSGGTLTNLQNSLGSASSTLVWGLVIDTSGNGFAGGYIPGFTLSDTTSLPGGQFLSTSGGVTDDRLIISGNLMTAGGTTDGSTGLAKPTNINLSYNGEGATGISALGGQAVAIMWFNATTKTGQATVNGDKYGFLNLTTAYSITTPADAAGGSLAFGASFIGADPVRVGNLTLGTAVPEPSAAFLGAIGALGLLRRRRN